MALNPLNLMNIGFMNEEIDLFDEDLSPRAAPVEEWNREIEELNREGAEIYEDLLQRIESIMAALTPMLQAMQDNDYNGPARTQLAHMTQSLQELKETKAGCSEELMKANQLLKDMKRQYVALRAKFVQMQQKVGRNTQLNGYIRGMGDRMCDTLRVNSYTR